MKELPPVRAETIGGCSAHTHTHTHRVSCAGGVYKVCTSCKTRRALLIRQVCAGKMGTFVQEAEARVAFLPRHHAISLQLLNA